MIGVWCQILQRVVAAQLVCLEALVPVVGAQLKDFPFFCCFGTPYAFSGVKAVCLSTNSDEWFETQSP